MTRPSRHTESAQTLVLMILVLTVLLGFAALAAEGGNAFFQRRQMQGSADSAAMAGIREITVSSTTAKSVASDYVNSRNSSAGASIHTLIATTGASSSCDGKTVPPYSLCVRVQRAQGTLFGSLLGNGNTVRAKAIATVSQVRSMSGWLPFGVMGQQFVSGTQISFRPGSVAPAGSINTPAGANCSFYGGNLVRDVIMSAANGGADACPIDIGSSIETQTGVTSGIITQGFDTRLGNNRDSFSDVFEFDAATNRYLIKKPTSPRLGIVPLAGGNGNWPLQGGQSMVVSGYAFAYIGDRSSAPAYPATTGSGNGLRIHITPVNALLPTTWNTAFVNYTAGANNILAYRLIT